MDFSVFKSPRPASLRLSVLDSRPSVLSLSKPLMPHLRLTPLALALLFTIAPASHADPSVSAPAPVAAATESDAAAVAAYSSPDWKLTWSDEFDRDGAPDPAKWNYEVGLLRNHEAQYYTKNRRENTRVQDGQLIITSRKEPWTENGQKADYTSASLTTRERHAFTCGKIEISARVPRGRGVWPALWTLGTNVKDASWPLCGEIDLMEFVGYLPDKLHFTVHTAAFNHMLKTQKGAKIDCASPYDSFHRFGLIWTPQKLTWFFDGRRVHEFINDGQGQTHWPFDRPQYLIMNLSIGGSWGGKQGIDSAIFPAEFRIDYVRIWQHPDLGQ